MSLQPSMARSLTAPLRRRPKSRSTTASLLGRLACVLVRLRNSPLIRSSAFVVRSAFHCEGGKRRKVNSSSPASSKLAATAGQRRARIVDDAAFQDRRALLGADVRGCRQQQQRCGEDCDELARHNALLVRRAKPARCSE